ncbi:YcbK family protein [Jiella sp. CQZ9-1]|uniref:YcbK family protein n=2 Tax=Jiella flava TaxID=2816857 RepID=A0A939JVN4_9HYPH|nr:YcbK family protein [Jiella flava]
MAAGSAPPSAPPPSPPGPTLSLRDRMSQARPAAFAGGRVSEGEEAADAEASTASGGASLFTSLFAREKARTPIRNLEKSRDKRAILKRDDGAAAGQTETMSSLPGVDPSSLFEIGQRASADEEDAIDDVMTSYRVASIGGFARLAPNGLKIARPDVQTACFPANLVGLIHTIERHFGARAVITSGYRSPTHNRLVNGALRSEHMACKAADLIVPGVSGTQVASFVRSLPDRGGVGTYCRTDMIHIDVGRRRDWNWRCRGSVQ